MAKDELWSIANAKYGILPSFRLPHFARRSTAAAAIETATAEADLQQKVSSMERRAYLVEMKDSHYTTQCLIDYRLSDRF